MSNSMNNIKLGGLLRTLYDISPRISARIAPFPGDVPFSRSVSRSFRQGHSYELSSCSTSVHVGAHVDAPIHYHPDGQSIEQRSLHYYLGPCQVLALELAPGEGIGPTHLASLTIKSPRVLFKTGSFPDPERWTDDFSYLQPEAIDYLAAQGVILVGIDTPSIDKSTSSTLSSHHRIYHHNMAILEGIVLTPVSPGCYDLVALPLNLEAADASPVRAILLGY
jgi:arylformamidase